MGLDYLSLGKDGWVGGGGVGWLGGFLNAVREEEKGPLVICGWVGR